MAPPGYSGSHNGSSKPFSFPSSNSATKKPAFNLQSNRGRPSDSLANKNRNLPRRPHKLDHHDDSDEEEHAPVHEEVSGFDTLTGGAITADGEAVKKEGPLVIPVTAKNNWRDRAGVNTKKGKKNLLPAEVQAMQEAQRTGKDTSGETEVEGPSMAYGLTLAQKEEPSPDTDTGDQPMPDATSPEAPPTENKKPLTEDQIALQALISESKGEVERRSDLVIEASKARDEEEGPTSYDETSSFRTDIKSRPESATLDQYNAIPVEEFGAALLRGMGWKDGQSIGRGNYGSSAPAEKKDKPLVPPRRPGFLGIGAKDTSGGKGAEAELGAWGKSAMRKASRKAGEENSEGNTEGVYMPVMMRNKKTGEYITEEELADMKKKATSEPEKDDWRERRDRNLEKSGRDRDREYRKRDYDDDRSDRKSSSRRDRSRSSGRHSSRRSRYDDDDDRRRDERSSRDSRDRDRDRDRRRDHDDDKNRRDRDRDRRSRDDRYKDDRYSSSRHSSSQSSRHDRDRDRDRDSRRSRRDD